MKVRKSLFRNCVHGAVALGLAACPQWIVAQDSNVAFAMLGSSNVQHHVGSFEIRLPPAGRKKTAPVVNALVATNDGRFLAASGDDHLIRIVDVQSGETLRTIGGHDDWIQSLVFSSDSQRLYSAGNDGRVLSWQHDYPVQAVELLTLPYAIRSLSLSSEKQLLAIGGFASEIIILDLASEKIKFRLQCECDDQRCVRFSPDGKHVLCGGRDGEVRIWETETGSEVVTFHAHLGRVYTAAFSSDGSKVTSVGDDRKLIRYDLPSRQVILKRELAQSKLMSLCVINDNMLAVSGADNAVHLYDALADSVIARLKGHVGTVAVMTPCGQFLASGSFDTTIRVWDLASIDREKIDSGKPVTAPLTMDSKLRIR